MLLDLPGDLLCDIFKIGVLGVAEANAIRAASPLTLSAGKLSTHILLLCRLLQ